MSGGRRTWRILVSGVGSVGERHIRNLLALGQDEIAVHRTRGLPFRTLDRTFPTHTDFEAALADWRPEVVFVTGPTSSHLPQATLAAEAGCHVFVEKPLCHSTQDVALLSAALQRSGRSLMVGYMLRFHPLLQRLKAWLEDGTLGTPLHWRSSWGEYLPDWHPWEDYRESYAAQKSLGGGPALTFSHDIDLALWLFGSVQQGVSLPMPGCPLQMDGPPGVDMLLRHASGVSSNLHLDFYQRPPQRSYELVATRGRAAIDYYGGALSRYAYGDDDAVTPAEQRSAGPAEVVRVPEGWDRNDMFVAELEHFLGCLARDEPPEPGVETAMESVRLAVELGEGGAWREEQRTTGARALA
jgi:predicted dehydrogenase